MFYNVLYRLYLSAVVVLIYVKGKPKICIAQFSVFSVFYEKFQLTKILKDILIHNLTIILCIEILHNKRNAFVYENSLISLSLLFSDVVFFLIHPPKVMETFSFFLFSIFHRLALLEFRVNY